MILSDKDLKKAIKNRDIIIDPMPARYSPSAIDLRMGDQLFTWDQNIVSQRGVEVLINLDEVSIPSLAAYMKSVQKQEDGSYVLEPDCFVHTLTYEKIWLPKKSKFAARVEGRSSLARLGVVVHLTAPTVHCGFRGRIALEIINFGPFKIKVMPGKTRICQLIVEKVSTIPSRELETVFINQKTPIG